MNRLHFTIEISATKEKVWNTLWEDESYRKWTSVFMQGSYAETDWKEGSEVLFLTEDGSGIQSLVDKNIPCEHMVFRHICELKKREPVGETWDNIREEYVLIPTAEGIHLEVTHDVTAGMGKYLLNTMPKAMEVLKALCEQ